ncbi:MAG: spondin domain-containing protein [Gammaproteobacteria bacterium]|jgi:hypothetical protein
MRKKTSLFVGCLLSTALLATTNSWAGDRVMYKITITNLTPGQPLAPVMAATHRSGMSFFEVGQAPSDELAMLAEAGDGNPMAAKLLAMPGVRDAQVSTMGLTFPGTSTTLMVSAKRGTDHVSIGAMLGATNDAFFAVTDVALPKGRQTAIYMADAYDAGSETNDELSSTVAGLGGEGYSPNDSGEGFVHIHSGIHGIGDADPAVLDWRNPVAQIVIERMNHYK